MGTGRQVPGEAPREGSELAPPSPQTIKAGTCSQDCPESDPGWCSVPGRDPGHTHQEHKGRSGGTLGEEGGAPLITPTSTSVSRSLRPSHEAHLVATGSGSGSGDGFGR